MPVQGSVTKRIPLDNKSIVCAESYCDNIQHQIHVAITRLQCVAVGLRYIRSFEYLELTLNSIKFWNSHAKSYKCITHRKSRKIWKCRSKTWVILDWFFFFEAHAKACHNEVWWRRSATMWMCIPGSYFSKLCLLLSFANSIFSKDACVQESQDTLIVSPVQRTVWCMIRDVEGTSVAGSATPISELHVKLTCNACSTWNPHKRPLFSDFCLDFDFDFEY